MNRWQDWWRQAQRDLRHAEHSREKSDHEWAAFAAHQAAEKGVKAASRLDKHYLPARYPNGLPEGFPGERYTSSEAEEAIGHARLVVEFCRCHLS